MSTTDPTGLTPSGLTPKGEATRDRIVAAAATLMHAQGVAGTSTEDVQRAAGVSASQIYHYFGDKKALVRAVIAFQTRTIVGAQAAALSELDSMAALVAWRDAIVALQRHLHCLGGCPLGSLASELSDTDVEARADLAGGYQQWWAAIRDGLASMQRHGQLRPEADVDRLALGALAAVQGGLLLTQATRDTAALEAVLDLTLDQIRSYAT